MLDNVQFAGTRRYGRVLPRDGQHHAEFQPATCTMPEIVAQCAGEQERATAPISSAGRAASSGDTLVLYPQLAPPRRTSAELITLDGVTAATPDWAEPVPVPVPTHVFKVNDQLLDVGYVIRTKFATEGEAGTVYFEALDAYL